MKNFTFLFAILVVLSLGVNAQKTYTDDFSVAHDYVANGVTGTMWDGLKVNSGFLEVTMTAVLNTLNTSDSLGTLSFSTTSSCWAGDNDNGVFLYKNIAADANFEVSVKIAGGDFPSNGATAVPYLMAGPMVRRADTISFLACQSFDQYSVGYGLRSIPASLSSTAAEENWTSTDDEGTDITTTAYPYMKLTRVGSVYTASCSADGVKWFDYQENERPDLNGHALQIGLYNATYTENAGKAIFDDFKLIDKSGTSAVTSSKVNPIKAYGRTGSITVNSSKEISSLKLIGIDGSEKLNLKNVNASSYSFVVEKQGVYILKSVVEGKSYTQKVLVY
jgi:hypothetical protein